jgi:oligosaccharide repeat unit polymerase
MTTVPLALAVLLMSVAILLYIHRLLYGRRQGPTPLGLFFAGWIPAVSLYLWNPLHLYHLHAKTWGFLLLGVGFFVFGYATITWAARGRAPVPPAPRLEEHLTPSALTAAVRLWWVCLTVGTALFLLYARSFLPGLSQGRFGTRLVAVRTALALGQVPAGFYYFYFYELLVPLSILLARLDRRHRLRYTAAGVLSFLALILTTGRTNATKALLLVLFVFLFEQGHRRLRVRALARIGLTTGIAVALFLIFGALIGKSYSNSPLRDESLLQPTSLPQQLRLPYLYYVGSLPAFDQLATGRAHGLERGVTLRPVLQVAHLADPHVHVPMKVQAFYQIPYPFNVSTYLAPLLVDFGAMGVIVGSFAVGGVCAWAYFRWLQSPSPAMLCLVALLGSLAFNLVGDFGANDLSWLVQFVLLAGAAKYGQTKAGSRRNVLHRHVGHRPLRSAS